MAQLVLGATGAVVSTALGFGPGIGWAIGSTLGGMLGPGQTVQGNRLTDLRAPKITYGARWPRVYGRMRTAGIILWQSELEEVETDTEAGGKGGPSTTVQNYTYYRSVLFGLADGTNVQNIARIWRNGELIFSRLAESDTATLEASDASEHFDECRFYDGNASQVPDPTYEAAIGSDSAIAYRNRATAMLVRINCGNSDQIGLFEFEIVTGVEETIVGDGLLCHFEAMDGAKIDSAVGPDLTVNSGALQTSNVQFNASGGGGHCSAGGITGMSFDGTQSWRVDYWGRFDDNVTPLQLQLFSSSSSDQVTVTSTTSLSACLYNITSSVATSAGGAGSIDDVPPSGQMNHWAIQYNANTARLCIFSCGHLLFGFTGEYFADSTLDSIDIRGLAFDEVYYRTITADEVYSEAGYTVPTGPYDATNRTVITPTTVDLADVVAAEHSRANGGITTEYDVSALVGIPVIGIACVGTAREAIETLRTMAYFDAVCTDKVYYVLRGGDSAATIPWASTGVGRDQAGTPFTGPARDNNAEVAQKVALGYANLDADYDPGSVTADRLTGESNKIDQLQLALVLQPPQAQGIAETAAADGRLAAMGCKVYLDDEYAKLQPTDVVTLTDEDGNTYRVRIVETTYSDGVYEHQVVLDDAAALQSIGITAETYSPVITVEARGDTELLLIDGPIGRDVDDGGGLYALMKPETGTNWREGAVLYESLDGATFTRVGSVTNAATFGTATTALGDWTGSRQFDETNSVTVNVGDGTLSSSTRTAILGDQTINAFAIGAHGRWEYGQFRDATLVSTSPNVYTLTGLLRGSRGTEHLTGTHAAGDSFALFTTAGTLRVPRTTPEIGVEFSYKGVTAGRNLSTATTQTLTDAGVGLLPFSPFDVRKSVDVVTGDITLTWQRRTRLQTRTIGALGISIPLGEESEQYRPTLYTSNTFATVLRTLSDVTTTSAVYTSAQQSADGYTPGSSLYVHIQQISAVVGVGTEAEATV